MKTKLWSVLFALSALVYVVESCEKTAATSSGTSTTSTLSSAISTLQAIAVGSTTTSTSALDSIYVINTCSRYSTKDSISFSSLPASVTNYLSTNYSGYTQEKAFSVTDSTGAAAGYIVIIQFNGVPVGLKFDATGAFVNVLDKRLGSELGGCIRNDSLHFHNRHQRDSNDHDTDDTTGHP